MKTPKHIAPWAALLLLVVVATWLWHGRVKPADVALVPRREATPASRNTLSPRTDAQAHFSPADIARMEGEMKACEADMAVLRRQRWEALGAQRDVESRLTHALMAGTLGEGVSQAPASTLLDALVVATPDDVDVAWYRASYCSKDSGCDREQAIGHLLELEPGNLDGWLMALSEASQRNQDEPALQALLERAAQADYYDPRTGETFSRLYQAMRDIPLPKSCGTPAVAQAWSLVAKSKEGPTAAEMAAMWAVSVSFAEIKAYSPIHAMCRSQDAPLVPQRAAACRPILTKLAEGDDLLDRIIGVGSMIGLTAGTPEGLRWRERYRNLQWMLADQSYELRLDHDEIVQRMTEGEATARERTLRAQDRWPAPEGWLPDDEHARSLIQTGRKPPESSR